jgi:hypothetical protein
MEEENSVRSAGSPSSVTCRRPALGHEPLSGERPHVASPPGAVAQAGMVGRRQGRGGAPLAPRGCHLRPLRPCASQLCGTRTRAYDGPGWAAMGGSPWAQAGTTRAAHRVVVRQRGAELLAHGPVQRREPVLVRHHLLAHLSSGRRHHVRVGVGGASCKASGSRPQAAGAGTSQRLCAVLRRFRGPRPSLRSLLARLDLVGTGRVKPRAPARSAAGCARPAGPAPPQRAPARPPHERTSGCLDT